MTARHDRRPRTGHHSDPRVLRDPSADLQRPETLSARLGGAAGLLILVVILLGAVYVAVWLTLAIWELIA